MMNTPIKTFFYEYEGACMYAQVFERNRDMGSEVYPLDDVEGQYKIQLVVDDETRKQMIKDGIPESSMGHDMFKPVEGEDGRFGYTFKRTHLHKLFKDDNGKPQVQGPPNVVDWNATMQHQQAVPRDVEQNIWNGSKVRVKCSIYKGRANIVTLESVGVIDLAEEPQKDEVIRW
mgnify:CR=1 FL=1